MLPDPAEQVRRQIHTPIFWKRVAVQEGDGRWHWFSSPIAFSLATSFLSEMAYAVLENECVEAAFRYPTSRIRVIEALTREAFDKIDWSEVR